MKFDKAKSDQVADKLLGMKFKMGGRGPEFIDCYGILTSYYSAFGITMPDFCGYDDWNGKEEYYLKSYSSTARKLDPDEKPEIGDFILFKNVEGANNHAGVYLGGYDFIHSYEKTGVRIDSLTNKVWKKKVYGYFRIKDGPIEGEISSVHYGKLDD